MEYRKLGNTGMVVSEVGLGTWGISGAGYGPVDPGKAQRIIHTALDHGVNFIDTADSYGNGKAEELIGKVLESRKDTETIIATKFGWDFYGRSGVRANLDPDYIKHAAIQSLRRLKRDRIDIYQIHCPRADRIEQYDVYNTLDNLRKEGIIRSYGISIKYLKDGISAIEKGHISTIQIPYNIINKESESDLIPEAVKNSIGIIVREPLASGLLSGKYNVGSKFHKKDHRNGWKEQFLAQQIRKVKDLRRLGTSDRSLAQAAICYLIRNRSVSTVIPGCRTIEQLRENLESSEKVLYKHELEYIQSIK